MEIPPIILSALDNRILDLTILPTEKCNFRCTYCYEDYKAGKINRSVVNGLKALLERRFRDLEILQISWFGGEPLLAVDVIEEISQHIHHLKFLSPKLIYQADITTNGFLLTLPMWTRLIHLGVTRFQISLDGDADIHNQTRRLANHGETFEQIWGNICKFRQSELQAEVVLRIHFTLNNYRNLDSLIEKINIQIGNDSRFKIFFKAVERLGGSNDENIPLLGHLEKEEIANYLYAKLRNSNLIFEQETIPICYAAKANSFVIRANGDIAKCTVALYDERNKVGHLNDDGTVEIDNQHFRLWLTGLETGSKKALACPYSVLKNK